jgi:hypothetical protein
MSKTRAENCWYQGCQRMKPKITSCYMPRTPMNLFMTENTYIPFSVWSVLTQTCRFNLIEAFGHQGWTEALTARMCMIQSRCETNILGRFILLWSVWKCFFTPEIKLSHKMYDVVLSELHLTYECVSNKLHVCTSKNTFFLVTEFIYDKTDLFRIISMYITAEVYFGYVINYCEANRLKFIAPGWIM